MPKRTKAQRREVVLLDRNGEITEQRQAVSPQERRLTFGDKWNYAPAPESSSHVKLRPRYSLFINGKFVAPRSGKYFDSINPATEEKLTEISEANPQDVDRAVRSARQAYEKTWGRLAPRERGKYLYRIA